MTINDAGLKLIKEHEGFSSVAYQHEDGVPTIGYGHTLGVKMGDVCTQEQAEAWLNQDVQVACKDVNQMTAPMILNSNQFSALVCLCYNIGSGDFSQSSVRAFVVKGDFASAADAILLWIKIKGKPSTGLLARRQAERALFMQAILDAPSSTQ